MVHLHVYAADGVELVSIVVEKDSTVTLGRDGGSTILLSGPEISRTHARLTSRGTFCSFEDANSKAGLLLVDEQGVSRKLKSGNLEVGQTLRIGTWSVRIRLGERPLSVVG